LLWFFIFVQLRGEYIVDVFKRVWTTVLSIFIDMMEVGEFLWLPIN